MLVYIIGESSKLRLTAGGKGMVKLVPALSAGAVRDQFQENRTAGLGQNVDERREGYGIGIISIKSIADAQPNVEVWQQVFGSNCEISQVDRSHPRTGERPARAVILHAAARVEPSPQGYREAQLGQVVGGVFQAPIRIVIRRLLEGVAGCGFEPIERTSVDFYLNASCVDLAAILILN